MQCRLICVHRGQIRRTGPANDIDVAVGVHGDAPGLVVERTAEVGPINQVRAGRIQLDHKRVRKTFVGRIQRVAGGLEVG